MLSLQTDLQYALRQLREYRDVDRAIDGLERLEEKMKGRWKVVLLPSDDGLGFTQVLMVPNSLTAEEAIRTASTIIAAAQKKSRGAYTTDDLREEAAQYGCDLPEVIHGPEWD